MIEIVENTKYIILIKNFSFGPIPQEDLIENFKDGRAFGLISEYILPAVSEGEIKKMGGNKFYDHTRRGVKIEQRTLTDFGLRLMPSNQIGSGRAFNSAEFKKKIGDIKWFFIIDNTKFPYLEAVFVRSKNIDLMQQKYRYSSARKKFFDCDNIIELEI